jgi:hypothetical protein
MLDSDNLVPFLEHTSRGRMAASGQFAAQAALLRRKCSTRTHLVRGWVISCPVWTLEESTALAGKWIPILRPPNPLLSY